MSEDPLISIDARLLYLREQGGRGRRLDQLMQQAGWIDAMAVLRELIVDRLKAQNTRGATTDQVIEARGGIVGLEDFAQAITNAKVEGQAALEEYARSTTDVPEGVRAHALG